MRTFVAFAIVTLVALRTEQFLAAGFLFGEKSPPTEVCYNYSGFDLGCFSKNGSFKAMPLPGDPKALGLRLFLYSPGHNGTAVNLSAVSSNDDYMLDINPNASLIFFVHGYMASTQHWHVKLVQRAIIAAQIPNLHLIMVDWPAGSSGASRSYRYQRYKRAPWLYSMMGYDQAASNTRIVGAIIANFASKITKSGLYSIRYVYCLGFSLGAHACGFAGKVYSKIGDLSSGAADALDRITGLDPAGPLFKGADPEARLDRSDAGFVDIIHTNALSLGINQTIGHVDFWVGTHGTWGGSQPGCFDGGGAARWALDKTQSWLKSNLGIGQRRKRRISWTDWIPIENQALACSHYRALLYFMHSLDGTCKYEIPATNNLRMGYFGKKSNIPPLEIDFHVTVNGTYPFCIEH